MPNGGSIVDLPNQCPRVRAAVIGAGLGGLAAGIRLQAMGLETLIFEKNQQPGGKAGRFEREGYVFDSGPTVVTAPETFEELFRLGNCHTQDWISLIPLDPFYQLCWEDGYRFDYSANEDSLKKQIVAKRPSDYEGYRKFYEFSQGVFEVGYEKLVDHPFLNFWDMVRVSPQLIKHSAYRSVYSMVASHIRDPQLRQAFSFHALLIGGNPYEASSIYSLIHALERQTGVHYIKGGLFELVQALEQLFQKIGGQVLYNRPVEAIQVERDQVVGVKTADGRKWDTDLVVSNADVTYTYSKLLSQCKVGLKRAKRLKKKDYSMSLFLLYFGTNRKYSHIKHHSILFGKQYRKLLECIFKKGELSEDFSLYLHRPTYTDPDLAPEGGDTFYVLSPVPHLGKWRGEWKEQAPTYAQKLIDYLERFYLPDLNQHIVVKEWFTPKDFQSKFNAHLGSVFSLAPTLRQSAYFRPSNRDENISGLYFVGAGTHPGAGVPGVLNSAKATCEIICNDFKREPELQWEPFYAR